MVPPSPHMPSPPPPRTPIDAPVSPPPLAPPRRLRRAFLTTAMLPYFKTYLKVSSAKYQSYSASWRWLLPSHLLPRLLPCLLLHAAAFCRPVCRRPPVRPNGMGVLAGPTPYTPHTHTPPPTSPLSVALARVRPSCATRAQPVGPCWPSPAATVVSCAGVSTCSPRPTPPRPTPPRRMLCCGHVRCRSCHGHHGR